MKNKIIFGTTAIFVLLAGTVLAGGYFHDFNGPGMHRFNETNFTEFNEREMPRHPFTTAGFNKMEMHGQFNGTLNNTMTLVKQKLGLTTGATPEEIRTALNSWATQNKDLLWALQPRMPTNRHRMNRE
jgi:hypothetical protein